MHHDPAAPRKGPEGPHVDCKVGKAYVGDGCKEKGQVISVLDLAKGCGAILEKPAEHGDIGFERLHQVFFFYARWQVSSLVPDKLVHYLGDTFRVLDALEKPTRITDGAPEHNIGDEDGPECEDAFRLRLRPNIVVSVRPRILLLVVLLLALLMPVLMLHMLRLVMLRRDILLLPLCLVVGRIVLRMLNFGFVLKMAWIVSPC